jgi:PIN domain nuclease of toxin-antitoxin system
VRLLLDTHVLLWHLSAPETLNREVATADPFDRLIYAQAMIEGLTLATRDRALLASGVAAIEA